MRLANLILIVPLGSCALQNPPPSRGDVSSENPFAVDPYYESYANQGAGSAAHEPYGTQVGEYGGVSSYSNAVLDCSPQPTCMFGVGDGRTTSAYGYEYQCVEYVVRYFAEYLGYENLNGNGNAEMWWTDPKLTAGMDLERYANGGATRPQPGDAIVFGGGTFGHIGVIRAVEAEKVHIIQQNWFHNAADADHVLTLTHAGSSWSVANLANGYTPLGWLRPAGSTVPWSTTDSKNTGCVDADGDSYGIGADCSGADCDDSDTAVHGGASEIADYTDNDCDGEVDEGTRVTLVRLYYSNGAGCLDVNANWDHCFSSNGTTCAGTGQGGAGYVADGNNIVVYPTSIGGGADTVTVGPYLLAALHSCYHGDALEHAYFPFDDPNLKVLDADPDWNCTTSPIGYVRSGSAIVDPHQISIHFHYASNWLSDRMYSSTSGEGDECGFEDKGIIFYAWDG